MACYPELANAYLTLAKEDATNNTKALQAPWSRSKFTVWCDTESILENPPRRRSTEDYGGKVVGQNGLHISSDMGWRMIVVTWNILKLQVRADPVGVSLRGKLWDQAQRHGDVPFRNGSPAPRATCWTLKNSSNLELGDVSWFFAWKLALTKYHLIHLHIVEMIWTSFSICSPVVKGLKMRVTWCISCR